MSKVMTELVVHKPANVNLAMLNYFKWRQAGEPHSSSSSSNDRKGIFEDWNRAAEKTDRLYASRHITPVVSELMRCLALDQPMELDDYIINFLSKRIQEEDAEHEKEEVSLASSGSLFLYVCVHGPPGQVI